MNLSIPRRLEVPSLIREILARRSVRRAIWVLAMAGLILCHLALAVMVVYTIALAQSVNDIRYSFITCFTFVLLAFVWVLPLDWFTEEHEDIQSLTPDS